MKKMYENSKLLILLVVIINLVNIEFAQAQQIDNTLANGNARQGELLAALNPRSARNVTSFDNRYEGVKGTQFVFDDWSEGSLMLKDSAIVKNKMLFKFDATQNEVWIKIENGQERILYNKELLALELYRPTGQKVKFKRVKMPNSESKDHFAQILYEGENYQLIKDFKKVFRKSNLEDKGIVTVGNPYDWFEEQNTYYIKKGNSLPVKITLKKGDVMEQMRLSRKLEEDVDSFCKKHNIKGKLSEVEALSLVEYIDKMK